jgi:TetR/AcrR family transcriptional repressor of nem operon
MLRAMSPRSEATRSRILDVTQRLIQARGFSAFSYADIAAEIGIKKASVHHHFATKAELAHALMVRYRFLFGGALTQIEHDRASAVARLKAYQQLFSNVLRDDNRMCMCGMLAADFDALPPQVRGEVRAFFDDNEYWISRVLAEGKRKRQLAFRGKPEARARLVLSTLEGAMLVARSRRDPSLFDEIADRAIADAVRA